MLCELKQGELQRIAHLLSGDRVNCEAKGIVAKNNPGWVWVDSLENPQTALVFSHGQQGFYFLGKEENQVFWDNLLPTIDQVLKPRLKALGIEDFEFSGTSLLWEETLPKLFSQRQMGQSNQYVYRYPNLPQAVLPDILGEIDARVVEITSELLANPQVDTGFVERNLLNWWCSLEAFLEKGTGYCVIEDNQAVSLCYVSFATDDEWELGVATHGDYRQRGFARAVTRKMLRRCQAMGKAPYWDCMETNTPSRRLAEGMGFSVGFIYQVFWFSLE